MYIFIYLYIFFYVCRLINNIFKILKITQLIIHIENNRLVIKKMNNIKYFSNIRKYKGNLFVTFNYQMLY